MSDYNETDEYNDSIPPIPSSISASAVIGANLKKARLTRGLTLDDVSSMSSVSKGMLSQIENGNKSPTINILYKICEAMHISMNALLRYPIPNIQVTHNTVTTSLSPWNVFTLFEYDIQNSTEISKAYIAPHFIHECNSHGENVWEYVLVIEGEFTLTLDDKTYTITKGESLRFHANRHHIYANHTDSAVWIYNLIFYDMPAS